MPCYGSTVRVSRAPRSASALLSLVLGIVFLSKALVPTGWMPAFDEKGIRLVVCGGWAPAPQPEPRATPPHHAMDAGHGAHHGAMSHHGGQADAPHAADHGGGHDDKSDHDRQQPCTFAAAALPWLGGSDRAVDFEPLRQVALAPSFPPSVAVGRGLAAPPPPATGPPLLT